MTAKPSMRTSNPSTSPQAPNPSIPYRQIRAAYDSDTIVLYQAYSSTIALPAVAAQKLNASPSYKPTRMTWLKPSWAWMIETRARAVGSGTFDPAGGATVSEHPDGVSGEVGVKWVEEWIDGIEDVTDMARRLKKVLDEEAEVGEGELIRRGLMPREKVYELDERLRTILRMDDW
ncbi:MAG: hypothetical protein L6R36_004402 [Xanthoria steineri]|nr:MAG: hypothetical protein L6R36_004402 [Xanthoria steineri]